MTCATGSAPTIAAFHRHFVLATPGYTAMSDQRPELRTTWNAAEIEDRVYQRWEDAGCFRAGAGAQEGADTYTIAIPPPNVTGVLHMGHALNNTLQDTLVRWQRMQGRDVLWQPGCDHAGIATQAVVAKDLSAQGISPETLDRQTFLDHIWRWKEQYGGSIIGQLKKLGSSCDWSRERFTMDEGLSQAVRENFVRLYEQGLIYQGTRMVNWDPVLQTALSDDEVEAIECDGAMWRLRYALSDGSGHIDVETTRPETFFADTAVAVHPDDPRYQSAIGKTVTLPIVGRAIPVIADLHANPEKGTGAVKITPFHDPNDYEVGLRHDLPMPQCIGFDGIMTEEAGQFAGQDRFTCRTQVLAELETLGVLQGKTAIRHAVGHGDRSHVPVEPMVTKQWFVSMKPLAERALRETNEGRVSFHPQRWTKVYSRWLEEVRDWCISRQIIWGHRIPAWHCADCGGITVDRSDPQGCQHCGSKAISQDPDVLDTWFSSALWPFSTLGWPDTTPELSRYYPTNTLVTDRGIIYFWVARMVMMGLFTCDQRPFDDVYIHGTVLDERGAKMSKSKGNGIDPLIMISGGTQHYLGTDYECPGYGADAVRFTLLEMTTEGQDLKLAPSRFEAGRNFANKVYNAGRFLLMNLAERRLEGLPTAQDLHAQDLGFAERWLLDRLNNAIDHCSQALERFRFSEYVGHAYHFFRDDLCDWYLEWAKRQFRHGSSQEASMAAAVLAYAFDRVLRLLHPGMPFISEYLWQELQPLVGGTAWGDAHLMLEAWPCREALLESPGSAESMDRLQLLVAAIRNIRNSQGLGDGVALDATLVPSSAADAATIRQQEAFICDRGHLNTLTVDHQASRPATAVSEVVGDIAIHVPLAGVVDQQAYLSNLGKQLAAKEKSAAGKRQRLANPGYVNKAPADKVQETRDLLAQDEAEIHRLQATIDEFSPPKS
ncbi:MAG: valine--tRNA ligase [Planctomycetota bacterium]|nr:MAG: valine--tRNA ligase [Planctomycetota bacterium]